jgi:hypothetical protein
MLLPDPHWTVKRSAVSTIRARRVRNPAPGLGGQRPVAVGVGSLPRSLASYLRRRCVCGRVYLAVWRAFELLVLCARSAGRNELGIVVLRHELAIARRQLGRPRPSPADGALLATLSRRRGRLPSRRRATRVATPCTES